MLAGSLFLTSAAFTSCEDFLTVLPTNQLPEESFWQDKNDLDNVRAGAYNQLAQSGQTSKILIWGELRSDNLELHDKKQTFISYLQDAVLQPSEGAFSWEGFYRGINYCNLVLEQGEKMTEPGNEVDPSFSRSDWAPIRTEMLSLRALYYFYLVKAFRDVPYVTEAVRDDASAREKMPESTPGVAILGELIQQLEDSVKYGATNYGNDADNKGRFTKTSTRMLLADMYLWRGCMLRNFMDKTNHGKVNISDTEQAPAEGVEAGANITYVTKDGTVIDAEYVKTLSNECFNRAIEYSSSVITDIHKDYTRDSLLNSYSYQFAEHQPYPLYRVDDRSAAFGMSDDPGYYIFYRQNSRESVFELQYDGTTMSNSTIGTYLSDYKNGAVTPGYMILGANLYASAASEYNPTTGFGKSDIRLIETCNYVESEAVKPIQKYICGEITIPDWADVTQDAVVSTYRSTGSSAINWGCYRLADAMLIKAEAIARCNNDAPTVDQMKEGFQLVNQLFARSNPYLVPTSAEAGDDMDRICDRMQLKEDYAITNKGQDSEKFNKTAADLLALVYQERQREFVGEGKRWFDIVRQVEASNDPKKTLTDFITVSNTVKNRLNQLYAFYNPIYSEELKVSGVENGGKLVQNPVWDRYTKK